VTGVLDVRCWASPADWLEAKMRVTQKALHQAEMRDPAWWNAWVFIHPVNTAQAAASYREIIFKPVRAL
jgi:hypothetical protein